jgi:hypothetical protein
MIGLPRRKFAVFFGILLLGMLPSAQGESMPARVKEAIEILEAKMKSGDPIPPEVVKKAKGIAMEALRREKK